MSDTQTPAQDTTDAGGTQTVDQGETQSTDAASAQTTDTTATQEAKPAEPAEIVYEFKAPEGVELDQTSLDEFKTIAKEAKLPAEAAQKLVDLAAKREVARAEAFAKQVQDWADVVSKDPELGKPENQAIARKAIDTFGTPELRDLLNSTGMGNHPEVVKLAYKIGKAISEDGIVKGRGDAPAPKSIESILFGTTTPKA